MFLPFFLLSHTRLFTASALCNSICLVHSVSQCISFSKESYIVETIALLAFSTCMRDGSAWGECTNLFVVPASWQYFHLWSVWIACGACFWNVCAYFNINYFGVSSYFSWSFYCYCIVQFGIVRLRAVTIWSWQCCMALAFMHRTTVLSISDFVCHVCAIVKAYFKFSIKVWASL